LENRLWGFVRNKQASDRFSDDLSDDLSMMKMMRNAIAMMLMMMMVFWASGAVEAAQYTVGESSGWGLGTDFDKWATQYTFHVGDDLCESSSSFFYAIKRRFRFRLHFALYSVLCLPPISRVWHSADR
jgi:hypothetical protein